MKSALLKSFVLMSMILAGVEMAAQRPVMVHSHNDYRQSRPFWNAYTHHAASIEADVYLVDGVFLVGHDREELSGDRTLEKMYIEPLVKVLGRNGGKAWKESDCRLQLMVELKAGTVPELDSLTALLSRWPEVFDPSVNENAVRVVVTGRVPAPEDYARYPDFISFDGSFSQEYTEEQMERVALMSANFADFSRWKGTGQISASEYERLMEAVRYAHENGKPVRFWNAPENETVYKTFSGMGIDYINSDRPEVSGKFAGKCARGIHVETKTSL